MKEVEITITIQTEWENSVIENHVQRFAESITLNSDFVPIVSVKTKAKKK